MCVCVLVLLRENAEWEIWTAEKKADALDALARTISTNVINTSFYQKQHLICSAKEFNAYATQHLDNINFTTEKLTNELQIPWIVQLNKCANYRMPSDVEECEKRDAAISCIK